MPSLACKIRVWIPDTYLVTAWQWLAPVKINQNIKQSPQVYTYVSNSPEVCLTLDTDLLRVVQAPYKRWSCCPPSLVTSLIWCVTWTACCLWRCRSNASPISSSLCLWQSACVSPPSVPHPHPPSPPRLPPHPHPPWAPCGWSVTNIIRNIGLF